MLEHNAKTLKEAEEYIKRGESCCVVNPCGSGKSSIMAAIIGNHPDKSFIVLTRQKNAGGYYGRLDSRLERVPVKTYNKLLRDYKNGKLGDYRSDILITDEAHYTGAEKWGEALDAVCAKYSPIVVGFTATPQRFEDQGTDETIVGTRFGGRSAGNYTSADLQKQGVFREPEYIFSLYGFEEQADARMQKVIDAEIPADEKAKLVKKIESALSDWKQHSRPEAVLQEALPRYMYKKASNRILVYMPSINEIDTRRSWLDAAVGDIFPGKRIQSRRYTHLDGEKPLEWFLEEDEAYVKILYTVDKVMETVHIDDLCVTIMLRPSVSNRIITQQFGRVNSIGNPNRALIIDMVGNLQNVGSVNFLGGSAGEAGTGKEGNKFHVGIKHALKYKSVFDAVDSVCTRFPRYRYGDFTGSLSQICSICSKPYGDVKMLMDGGMPLEEALEKTRGSKPLVTQEIFDGYEKPKEFRLSEDQKEACGRFIPLAKNFIKQKGIKDEDIEQELYMELLYRLSLTDDLDKPGTRGYLINALNSAYARMYKHKTIHDGTYCEGGLNGLKEKLPGGTDPFEPAEHEELKRKLIWAVRTLTEKEKKVIALRFGLDGGSGTSLEDCGKAFGVTRERVRQIEAKALRKLRHPTRCAGMRGMLDVCA